MNGLTPDKIPVLSFLADNFALFDEYFCSVPGPTIPNRFFALTGTAAGLTNTGFDCFIIFSVLVFFMIVSGPFYRNIPGLLFPQKTIFEQLLRCFCFSFAFSLFLTLE